MEQLTHIQMGAREAQRKLKEPHSQRPNKITASSRVIPMFYDTSVINDCHKGGGPSGPDLKPFSNVNQHVPEAA